MRTLKGLTLLLMAVVIMTQLTHAQSKEYYGNEAGKLITGADYVRTNDQRSTVSYVRLAPNVQLSKETAAEWLKTQVLRSQSGMDVRYYRKAIDKIGYEHLRYQQVYRGVPVEYSMYIVHTKDGKIVSANGEAYTNIQLDVTPSLSVAVAQQRAYKAFPAQRYLTSPNDAQPELVVLPLKEGQYSLAYKIDVYTEEPLSRQWVYVHAQTGTVIRSINRLETFNVQATAGTQYSGTQTITTDSLSATSYRLRETGRGAGAAIETYNLNHGSNYGTATDFTHNSKVWPSSYDNAALDAHYGAEKTYDHYYNKYGHNSLDNAGMTMKSYVHYSSNYVNAYWNGSVMTYGDGDGVSYLPLTSLEIVGHEMTHGVTEFSAALIYSGESGALNESFSDLMGNTIRFETDSTATWLVGDQIVVPGGSGSPFRNMANPNDYQCADTYGGLFFNNGDVVHYDSGIQNFWYYLLTEGGTGVNDNGDAYTVLGIGLNDANAIAYRNLTVYLTPSSTFADARAGAIQAAIDLFGSCSNQVIQTTNAWYAVGVGGLFNNAVVASFQSNQNYLCTVPASVNFINNSMNATSYHWDFGDGNTSTLANPSHTYTAAGTYAVELIAIGSASCGNSDTMLIPAYIVVSNGGGPVTPSCSPNTIGNCCGIGITNVTFGSINKTSANASEGYKDFSCSDQTTLVAGNTYPISLTTGTINYEDADVWIDYNNDGVFATTEKVFSSLNKKLTHTGYVNTPVTAVLNTSVRMRVMDEDATYLITGSCYDPTRGQAEDYTVIFTANTLPPVADFTVNNQVVNVAAQASFYDLTANAPTGWTWSFPGGVPATSSLQNPVVQYNSVGVYPVTLHVLNAFGTDSITKTAYITVVNSFNMCSNVSTASPAGLLYDSGGPSGDYQDNENCTFLISPACADTVILTIHAFSTESGYDYLRIYDGISNTGTLLFSASGSTATQTVKAPSGNMFIQFTSDGSVTSSGYYLSWNTALLSSAPPVAAISVDDTTPPVAVPVQFHDLSAGAPSSWYWYFGDGNTSTQQHPTHAYTAPGSYTVTMISYTCNQSDTTTLVVTVQDYPVISIVPDSISGTVGCGDSIRIPVMVYNTGGGDLVISGNTVVNNSGTYRRVLACTFGVDLVTEYANTIAGISASFSNYSLATYNGIDSAQLRAALDTMDVLLFPENESGSSAHYLGFAPVISDFIGRGGDVIVCSDYGQRLADMGLFTSTGTYSSASGMLDVLDSTHFITDSVPVNFLAQSLTIYKSFTNAGRNTLVSAVVPANEIVTYREIGSGSATFIGYDYYTPNTPFNRIIANAVAGVNGVTSGTSGIDPSRDTIAPGDSALIYIVISTANMNAGTLDDSVLISSNDPTHSSYYIPYHITITGSSLMALSDTCLHFADVFQNISSYDTLQISNNGCDTLVISNIISSAGVFIPDTAGPVLIPPFTQYSLPVQFLSAVPGTFSGQLTIFNNDQDTNICMTGTALGAPVAEVQPDTLFVTMNCTDSTTQYLTLYNTGLSDLEINIEGLSQDTLNLLMCTYGVDMAGEYLVMMNAINSRFQRYHLTQFTGTSAAGFSAALSGIDVVIFPEMENGTGTHYTSWATAINNFVSGGGRVVIAGTYNSNRITEMGLITGTFQNYVNSGTLTTLDTTHFVTDSIGLTVFATNSTMYHTFTDPACVHLVKFGTYDVVSYKDIGQGEVVFLGFDYFSSNAYTEKLLVNAITGNMSALSDWMDVDELSDTLAPGDSIVIPVVLTTNNHVAGQDTGLIVIYSNDPLHPELSIPVILTITGAPAISLSDSCLNFGAVMQGDTLVQTLDITNDGCDTLFISGILVTGGEFTVDAVAPIAIAPGAVYSLTANFSSSSIGSFSGSLQLLNNDHDTTICLTGAAFGPPVASVYPDTIYVTQNCGDTTSANITVYNSGVSDLYVQVGEQTGTVQILACTWGVDLTGEYNVMLQAMSGSLSNYTISTYSGTDSAALAAALVGKQVLLFPEQETGSSVHYVNFAPVVSRFMAGGGRVVVCGSANTATRLSALGLFSGTLISTVSSGTLSRVNAAHFITQNIPATFTAPDATTYYNFTDPSKIQLVTYGSVYDVVTYKAFGFGEAIYLGFDYWSTSTPATQLLANCIAGGSIGLDSWIILDGLTDTVAVGDSLTFPVVISSVGQVAGVDTSVIEIATNDPLHPVLPVVVILTTVGNPNILLSDSCIYFGQIAKNVAVSDTLVLTNNGCDTLSITSMVMSDPAFSYTYSGTGQVAPGGIINIVIEALSADTGWYNGTLTIHSNLPDTVICLSAYFYGVPELTQYADTVYLHTSVCSDSVVVPVNIYSTGEDTLSYSVSLNSPGTSSVLRIVALTYGVDLAQEYAHTISAINQYFTNYTLTTVSTASASLLSAALANADVLLMPEPETGISSQFTPLATVIQNFISSGKTAIYCGASSSQMQCILNSGVFTGLYASNGDGVTLSVVNTSSPYTAGVPALFTGQNATFCMNISNPGKVQLVTNGTQDVVSYITLGQGKAFYIAFDYYLYTNNEARLISNILSSIQLYSSPDWVTTDAGSETVVAGDSAVVDLVFHPELGNYGTNTTYLIIQSNDPALPVDSVVVIMDVDLQGCAAITASVDSCGHSVAFSATAVTPTTTYSWSFGDGNGSTQQSPVHQYVAAGTYTVRLIIADSGYQDTTYITIQVGFNNGPQAAFCTPATLSYCCNYGILGVQMQSINKLSAPGSDGYQDYTCTDSTSLDRGQLYNLQVLTDSVLASNVSAWIDYNNNGLFSPAEQLFTLTNVTGWNTGNFTVPANAVTNTPLRMRIGADVTASSMSNACTDLTSGQYEDYTVWLRSGTGVNENSDVPAVSILPNPFGEETVLSFELRKPQQVSVKLFDALGKLVSTPVDDEELMAGVHRVRLQPEVSGVYYVRLTGGNFSDVYRIIKTK